MLSQSAVNFQGEQRIQFSPEVIDYILSFLDAEDKEERMALGQCILVSRAFCCLSRYHLFAKVSLADSGANNGKNGETKQGSKLLQILEKDPLRDVHPLALQMRNLEVSFFDASQMFRWVADSSIWPDTLQKSLPAILDILQNLHTFQLKFEVSMDWNVIGKPLYDSLARLFASPRLTSISISKLHNFRPEILQCPNLRDLRLDGVSVRSFFETERLSGRPSCWPQLTWAAQSFRRLENFEAHLSDDVLAETRAAKENGLLDLPFSRLKNHTIHVPINGDIFNEWWAIKCATQTLECLTVNQDPHLSDSYEHFPGPIHLPDFISLHTLVLRVEALPNDPPSALHNLISLLSPRWYEPTTIRRINIVVNLPATQESVGAGAIPDLIFVPDDSALVWKQIENAILGPAFPSLDRVQFTFRWLASKKCNSPDDDMQNAFVKESKEMLAGICAKICAALPEVTRNKKIGLKADWEYVILAGRS